MAVLDSPYPLDSQWESAQRMISRRQLDPGAAVGIPPGRDWRATPHGPGTGPRMQSQQDNGSQNEEDLAAEARLEIIRNAQGRGLAVDDAEADAVTYGLRAARLIPLLIHQRPPPGTDREALLCTIRHLHERTRHSENMLMEAESSIRMGRATADSYYGETRHVVGQPWHD